MNIDTDVYRCRRRDGTAFAPDLIVMIFPCPTTKGCFLYLAYYDYGTAASVVFKGEAYSKSDAEAKITLLLTPWGYEFAGSLLEIAQ